MLYELGIFIFIIFWLLCGRLSYKISLWESKRNSSVFTNQYNKKQWGIEDNFIALLSGIFGVFSLFTQCIDGSWERYANYIYKNRED